MIMIIIIPIIVRTIAMTKILKIVMLIISYNLYIINDNEMIKLWCDCIDDYNHDEAYDLILMIIIMIWLDWWL